MNLCPGKSERRCEVGQLGGVNAEAGSPPKGHYIDVAGVLRIFIY
jgi:hypothetical protein